MNEPHKEDDQKRFNDTLKRMLKTPPKPHKDKDADPKPDARKRDSNRDKK